LRPDFAIATFRARDSRHGRAEGLLRRIVYVSEGNAETFDSWSGVSRSVVRFLRDIGHRVRVADADLYGSQRLALAMRTVSWPRRRWWVQYHVGPAAFAARSAACARAISPHLADADVVLQIGATFAPPTDLEVPLVLYCDSNIELARAGRGTGYSEAAVLSDEEIEDVRAREAKVYERAEVIFTMSERLRESFISDFGISPERLVTVHCGPNLDELPPPRTAAPDGPPTILFIGRDFERKGGSMLLHAFRVVRDRVPDARLVVVGGRPGGSIAVPNGVEFRGFLSRDTASGRTGMERAYREASVFCVPSRFEPFGTSYVEAMLHGIPCVGPHIWAIPEIIVDGVTGYTVPPTDAEALADALVSLLANPPEAQRMGDAARVRAVETFSWEQIAEKMTAAMDRVLTAR